MFKKYIPLCVMLISLFCTNIIGNYATHRDLYYNEPPLFDVVHEWFNPIPYIILDYVLLITNTCSFLLLLYHSYKQKSILYFNKLFILVGILYLTRCLCIYVTYLPNSRPCDTYDTTDFINTIRKDFCGDLMFSGHTFQFVIGCIVIYMFYPNKWIKLISILASITYALLISISRLHYTIDVIIALYTTVFVYQNVEHYYPICMNV